MKSVKTTVLPQLWDKTQKQMKWRISSHVWNHVGGRFDDMDVYAYVYSQLREMCR